MKKPQKHYGFYFWNHFRMNWSLENLNSEFCFCRCHRVYFVVAIVVAVFFFSWENHNRKVFQNCDKKETYSNCVLVYVHSQEEKEWRTKKKEKKKTQKSHEEKDIMRIQCKRIVCVCARSIDQCVHWVNLSTASWTMCYLGSTLPQREKKALHAQRNKISKVNNRIQ